MPIVPTSTSPSVAPAGLPGAQYQTPTRFLAESQVAGEQMSKLGAGAVALGDDMLAEQARQQIGLNEAAAKDYDTKLMGAIQAIHYGTPDAPDTGYMALKGKTAVDAFDTTVQKLQQLPHDLSDGLQNPAQQELVKATAQTRIQAAMVQAAQHRDQQADVWQKTAGEVRVKTAQESAPLAFNPITDSPRASYNADDPSANSTYQQALQTIRSETLDQAQRMGLPQDVAQDLANNSVAKAYALTLAHLIDRKGGNPADLKVAQGFFDSVKDDLPAEVQDKVRSLLEVGQVKDKALSLAIDIKGSISGINAQEQELDKQFKAGTITPEVHDMALQHLRADNSQRRAEQGEGDKAMLGKVWDIARKGGSITDLSPSDLAYVKNRGLGVHIDQIFKRGDDATFDDSQKYTDLMRMSVEDPSAFVKMELAPLSGELTKAHWNQLVGIQTSVNRQDVKAMDVLKVQHNAVQDAKSQLLAAGMNLSPKPNTDAAKQLDQFTASLHDSLTAAQQGWQEKKLTPNEMRDEARSITLGMLKDQALSGSGYFGTSIGQTHKPVWQMTQEQRAAPWDIPPTERQQIVQSLQRANQPTTEDAIQRVYKAAQGLR